MSVPHPGGDPNANLYYQLKRDVLDRVPVISSVEYVPNRAEAMELRATFDTASLGVELGPEPPTLAVAWYRGTPNDWFRTDYSDPNSRFHAGWHQDEDHADIGPTHFQYTSGGDTNRREATFEHETPSLVLWEIIERLLEDVLPTHYD